MTALKFSAIVAPTFLVFITPDGRTFHLSRGHGHDQTVFETACRAIQAIQDMYRQWPPIEPDAIRPHLDRLLAIVIKPYKAPIGRVAIIDGVVYFAGKETYNSITSNILWSFRQGLDVAPLMRFLDKLMDNPSYTIVHHLHSFISHHSIVIDGDGDMLAYRKVPSDFRDTAYNGVSGFLAPDSTWHDNSPGQTVTVERNLVDDDISKPSGDSLHCCSYAYLSNNFPGSPPKTILVKVNPRDVVAIPVDYSFAVMRVCEYHAVQEIVGDWGISAPVLRLPERVLPDEFVREEHVIALPEVMEVGDTVIFTGDSHYLSKQTYTITTIKEWAGSKYAQVEGSSHFVPLSDFTKVYEEGMVAAWAAL